MTEEVFTYTGTELSVFYEAGNWKEYWASKIEQFMGSCILEVGAGLGANTRILCNATYDQWIAIEPDYAMVAQLQERKKNGEFPPHCKFRHGTVQDIAANELFDTVIYLDVLEHIQNDAEELLCSSKHVKVGGHLIVLAPAYQFLFSEFDRAVGHFRRYDREMLSTLTPPGFGTSVSYYLDSIGLLASLTNLVLLRSSQPTLKQILFWDTYMVRLSRILDPLVNYSFGRSILCVWERYL